jgi:hypothetical protein
LWLLSALLIFFGSDNSEQPVRLVDSRIPTALAPHLWTVPVARITLLDAYLECPGLIFAFMAGGLLTLTIYQSRAIADWKVRIIFVALLSLTFSATWLSFVVLYALTLYVWQSDQLQSVKKIGWLTCLPVISILLMQDFGFFILTVGLLLLTDVPMHGRWTKVAVLCSCLGLIVPTFLFTGYPATGMRFLNWISLSPHLTVTSQTQGLFHSSGHYFDGISFDNILLVLMLCVVLVQSTIHQDKLISRILLTMLGISCTYYLWPVTFVMLVSSRKAAAFSFLTTLNRRIVVAGLCIAAMFIWPYRSEVWNRLAKSITVSHVIDPVAWSIRGKVLLFDLDESSQWQTQKRKKKYQLILDDRWEVGADQLLQYEQFCRDLDQGWAHSYLRSDLHWGGYAEELKKLSPALLVIPSHRLSSIRRLSLSPHWTILGIDAERTYFGYTKHEDVHYQSQRAIQLLSYLEWPTGRVEHLPEHTIVAESWDESLQISRVLNTMRFPYAALRYLPEKDDAHSRLQRSLCWQEISHRVQRYSGKVSLIDQYRALAGYRSAAEKLDLSSAELKQMAISANAIGGCEVAYELVQKALNRLSVLSPDESLHHELILLSQQSLKEKDAVEQEIKAATNPEVQFRLMIKSGITESVGPLLQQMDPQHRPFYQWIFESREHSASTLYLQLSQMLKQGAIPKEILEEAYFYQGCLGLEVGDVLAAMNGLQSSRLVQEKSAYEPLRVFYLSQLSRGQKKNPSQK